MDDPMRGIPDEFDITTDPTVTWYNLENHSGFTSEYGYHVDPHDSLNARLKREGMHSRQHTYTKWYREKKKLDAAV